jgi:hypothetical protein
LSALSPIWARASDALAKITSRRKKSERSSEIMQQAKSANEWGGEREAIWLGEAGRL